MSMKFATQDFQKVKKFIYPFGYKTTIEDKMYPAYYRAYLLYILGTNVNKARIEKELDIETAYLNREEQENK